MSSMILCRRSKIIPTYHAVQQTEHRATRPMTSILRRLEAIIEMRPTAYQAELKAAVDEIKRLRLALSDIMHYQGDLGACRTYARKTLEHP